jgi:hypothetical protein
MKREIRCRSTDVNAVNVRKKKERITPGAGLPAPTMTGSREREVAAHFSSFKRISHSHLRHHLKDAAELLYY